MRQVWFSPSHWESLVGRETSLFFTMSLHNDSPAENLKRGSEPTWLAVKLTIIKSLLNRFQVGMKQAMLKQGSSRMRQVHRSEHGNRLEISSRFQHFQLMQEFFNDKLNRFLWKLCDEDSQKTNNKKPNSNSIPTSFTIVIYSYLYLVNPSFRMFQV